MTEGQRVASAAHAEREAQQNAEAPSANAYRQLVAWVAERWGDDCGPAQIFNSVRQGGWSREDAVAALTEALPPALHEQVHMLSRGAPDPDFSRSPGVITIGDHAVKVLCEWRDPRVVVFGSLLSRDECDELIAAASSCMARSMVTGNGMESVLSDVMASSSVFVQRDECALLARIEARIAALLGWPAAYGEDMQVLRYGKEQQDEPHHDFFTPEDGPWDPVFRHGGQRVATLVIHLNTPPLGGSTAFPDLALEVRAVTGNAVFFVYETPDASSRTLHGGTPVGEGEKWIAVKRFRQGALVEAQLAPQAIQTPRDFLMAWARARHAEGFGPAQLFNILVDSGLQRDKAIQSLAVALPQKMFDHVFALSRPAPDPDFSGTPGEVDIDGHVVRVLYETRQPRVVVFGNLLTPAECEELMAAGRAGSPGPVLLQPDGSPLRATLEARISRLLDWPGEYTEALRVQRFGPQEQQEPQPDLLDPPQGDWDPVFHRGGRRVASLVIHLNTPPAGGTTVFPDIPMDVRAIAGNAVFYAYESAEAGRAMRRGELAPAEGERWVAVKWFRQGL